MSWLPPTPTEKTSVVVDAATGDTLPHAQVSLAVDDQQVTEVADGWDLNWRDAAVLKPYLQKALSLRIALKDSKRLTIEAQPKLH